MMRFRRVVAAALAAGAVAGTSVLTVSVLTASTAHAGNAIQGQQCSVPSTTNPHCLLSQPVQMPLSSAVSVTTVPRENASVSWTVSCTRNGTPVTRTGTHSGTTPFQARLAVPATNAADCTFTATVTVTGRASMTAGLVYTTGSPVEIDIPQGANYSGQPIYALRCLTDPGNNPKAGVKVVIMACETLYSQAWTFRNGELVHGRYCLTDKGDGGIRTGLILAACTGAADQLWTFRLPGAHAPEGAFVLKAHGGGLCLDDPKTSTSNGTQLMIFPCNGGNSQKWSMG